MANIRPFTQMDRADAWPDGSVIDAEGCLWNAQWSAGRVARYDPTGTLMGVLHAPAAHTTCPALGGEHRNRLMLTTARAELGREATDAELAAKLGVAAADIPEVDALAKRPYAEGGFKVWDIKDRKNPKLLTHVRTHGRGVHRFDMDANYAYISTEMPGFIGNILVIYDIRNPAKPEEVSKWWMPGQKEGEHKSWPGRQHRLHHALRSGDRLFAGCWHGGVRIIDVSDIKKPTTIGEYNYHPPFPEPSHTFMDVPFEVGGRRIALAIDEEDHAH
ncbi:SMP-30/gluconolactonase/LRE family protein, partial [Undibacterium luofuense]|uniref:SMP-30/gluconolactonase/LRE family protein n=1 Tax=Undibacterium luofuense TaxID=2828733 RepID=UPI0030EC29CD